MSTPEPDGPAADQVPARADLQQQIRLANSALVRRGATPLLAVGLLLVVGLTFAQGWSGLWGSLVGLLLVVLFYGSDVVLMRRTVNLVPTAVFAVMVMAFTFKLTVLGIFLAGFKDTTLFSVEAFAISVLVLTVLSLGVAVWLSARMTTTLDPELDGGPGAGSDRG